MGSPDILRILPKKDSSQRRLDDYLGDEIDLRTPGAAEAISGILFNPRASLHLETSRLDGHPQNGTIVVIDPGFFIYHEPTGQRERPTLTEVAINSVRTLIDFGYHSARIGYPRDNTVSQMTTDEQALFVYPDRTPGIFNT